jgi:hypothetical protein
MMGTPSTTPESGSVSEAEAASASASASRRYRVSGSLYSYIIDIKRCKLEANQNVDFDQIIVDVKK